MKLLSLVLLCFIAFSLTACNGNLVAAQSLQYLVRQPKTKTAKPPLIILLHGVGSNETDLFSLADQLPDNFLVISARAPYTIDKDRYGWYELGHTAGAPVANKEQAEKSRKMILAFIDELKAKYAYDASQVYLCGFSQGAIMSYSVGLTRPDKIKGIMVLSGRLLEEVKPAITKSEQLKGLHVFISHGTNDNILGIHYAREAKAYLDKLGIRPTYKEYTDVHTINRDMLGDMVSWLGKQ